MFIMVRGPIRYGMRYFATRLHFSAFHFIDPRARAAKGYCSRLVGRSVGRLVYGTVCGTLPLGSTLVLFILLTLAHACAAKGYCSRLVGRSVGRLVYGFVYPHIFSRTWLL